MKPLFIFDFDDTLALTDSHVRVIGSDGQTKRLDSREFASYRHSPGDTLDFSEFNRADGTLIDNTVEAMQDAIRSYGIKNVYIVTARAVGAPVAAFLESFGLRSPPVIATAGSEGKARWLARKLHEKKYTSVFVYEDCRKNITMLRDIVDAYNQTVKAAVKYNGVCVLPGGRLVVAESPIGEYIQKLLEFRVNRFRKDYII